MTWILDNLDLILQLTLEHLRQCIIAIVLGFVLSIPLGYIAWRFGLLRGWVITITGMLYTIPSLALLILLPTVFGYSALSDANLIIALTLYAIAIMVRSVVDGLDSVDTGVRGAATAMGFSGTRRFFGVEFPLAGPVILAGLRVASVSTISLATVGILVGVTNLGYLFTNGLQRRIIPEVLSGVVAVVILALVIDVILVLAGRLLMPWNRRSRIGSRTAAPATSVGASA
ncbi:ABC transporter permease [Microbacterium schleiferi]|uniref:ABC transporter permease n=1 Tax=Microbacterium schleiferi TaxID=69362 RepID=A0A7S8RG38_9MICO|nr:ABC transporter permease [Microbacterium schleiferi]QPE03806.1 ABC transporter permease [Microbacterium schleiferi]